MKSSTTGASSSSAQTSAPERSARMPTRPRWSVCWWVMTIRSRSSTGARARACRVLERDQRAARVRADVDQRQRIVVDQVAVDRADPERRRDREAGGSRRISASTSSRRRSMSSRDQALEVQPQQRLGVRRAHVEVPVVVVDRDAVELGDLGVGVARLDLVQLRPLVGDLGVDLAGDEVLARVVGAAARRASVPAWRAARGSAARGSCRSRRCRRP